jgi:hypothetical protein
METRRHEFFHSPCLYHPLQEIVSQWLEKRRTCRQGQVPFALVQRGSYLIPYVSLTFTVKVSCPGWIGTEDWGAAARPARTSYIGVTGTSV